MSSNGLPLYRVARWDEKFENNRTRELAVMRWLPVDNRLDTDQYTELIDHPDGPAHFAAWFVIVLIASSCGRTAGARGNPAGGCGTTAGARRDPLRRRGVLLRDANDPISSEPIPHTAQSLARLSRMPAALFEAVIPRLLRMGLLERISLETQEVMAFALEEYTTPPQVGAGAPQEGAGFPQEGAAPVRDAALDGALEENRREEIREERREEKRKKKDSPETGEPAPGRQPELWGKGKIRFDPAGRNWLGITEADLTEWSTAYPAVDVRQALAHMAQWCIANPAKGRKQNYRAFIVRWLGNQQDRGGSHGGNGRAVTGGAGAAGAAEQRRADKRAGECPEAPASVPEF